jgi:hypothetical protein
MELIRDIIYFVHFGDTRATECVAFPRKKAAMEAFEQHSVAFVLRDDGKACRLLAHKGIDSYHDIDAIARYTESSRASVESIIHS